MSDFIDHFSGHAAEYADARPVYPRALYQWLAAECRSHELAWDCATGSGQAACALADYFDHVYATDASVEQLRHARPHPSVEYHTALAEASGLQAHTADLVTVAQAVHWFDIEAFYREVRRVLKPDGLIAVWSYGFNRVSPELDPLLKAFYSGTVGPFWPPERGVIDDQYQSLRFPFREIDVPHFEMRMEWNLDQLLAYFRTWSATRGYMREHGSDPVPLLREKLLPLWGDPATVRAVRWPLFIRAGRLPG